MQILRPERASRVPHPGNTVPAGGVGLPFWGAVAAWWLWGTFGGKISQLLGGWVGWCLPGYKMVKKAGVVPQAGGQPQVCYWVLRGALPKGEKVFWRPVRGILFTKIVENVVFPKKIKKYQKKKDKNCAP